MTGKIFGIPLVLLLLVVLIVLPMLYGILLIRSDVAGVKQAIYDIEASKAVPTIPVPTVEVSPVVEVSPTAAPRLQQRVVTPAASSTNSAQ